MRGKTKRLDIPKVVRLRNYAPEDFDGACRYSTRQCVHAKMLKRVFQASYVSVDDNGVTMTVHGMYYHFRMTKKSVLLLRQFDENPAAIARDDFEISMTMVQKPEPVKVANRRRKDQINEARRQRKAKIRAEGKAPKTYAPALRAQLKKPRVQPEPVPSQLDEFLKEKVH